MDPKAERNRAVVVSVAEFYGGKGLRERPGAKKDAKSVHRTLSKLGFKVDVHSDLSSQEIYQLFHKGNAAQHSTYPSLKYPSLPHTPPHLPRVRSGISCVCSVTSSGLLR